MKILVTGSAGFIGFHLVQSLLARGDEVIGLDNLNSYYDPRLKEGRLKIAGIDIKLVTYNHLLQAATCSRYQFIKLNLEDEQNITALFKKERFDAVCHLGAQAGVRYSLSNPQAYINSNIIGFANILEGCRHHGVKNLSYASSSSVYGLNKTLPFATTHNVDHPVSLYAATKKSNELMAHTYSHLYDIASTGLRFFTVYGPWGRPDMAPFLFTKAALESQEIEVFNYGQMSRDFTYIDDIIAGVIRVIDCPASSNKAWDSLNPAPNSSPAPYKIYNIGNNNPIALMDFIGAIEKKLGKTIPKKMLPIQAGDIRDTYADTNDLVADFNYHPTTSLQDGINKFIDWYCLFFKV